MTVATVPAEDTDTPSVIQAITNVMRQVLAVSKGDRNTQQNFNFRGIDSVLNAVGPALRNAGIVTVPTVTSKDIQVLESKTSNGQVKRVRFAVIDVDYTFYGPRGDSITASVVGEAMDYGDKVVSKAMSVAYRTALIQTLSLPTQEADPDAYTYDINGDAPEQQEPPQTPAQQEHRQPSQSHQRAVNRARQEPAQGRDGDPVAFGAVVQQVAAQVKPKPTSGQPAGDDQQIATAQRMAREGKLHSLLKFIEQLENDLGPNDDTTVAACAIYKEAKEAADAAEEADASKYRTAVPA